MKKANRHRTSEGDYVWNSNTWVCKCHKDWNMGEYLKYCTGRKSLVDDLAVTCNEMENIPENASINCSNGIIYWLVAFVLLAIACLLQLIVMAVKYCMKHDLTIPYRLSILMNNLARQWLFRGDNKKYFTSNNTEAHCGVHLLANWMRQNNEKVLE